MPQKKLTATFPNLWWKLCLTIGVIVLTVYPRISSLELHWAPDERLWLTRSHQFIQSIKNGDLKKTVTAPHPGVTTMWLGGLALSLKYKSALTASPNLISNPLYSTETLAVTRTGVVLTTIVAILIAWYLLFKLLGWWTSFLAILFIAVNPFYLSLSRILHTDALAASFTLLTVLFLLVCLERPLRLKYIIFSGICLGLACLSKVTAFALVLYLPILLAFYNVNEKRDKNELNCSMPYLYSAWLGTAFLTAVCLWPGLWTVFGNNPLVSFLGCVLLLLGIICWSYRHILMSFSELIRQPKHLVVSLLMIIVLATCAWKAVQPIVYGLDVVTRPHEVAFLFLGKIVHNPGPFFYPLVILLRSSPFTLPLLILGLVWFVFFREASESKMRRIFFASLILILLFTVLLSLATKKISRYILPIFPFIDILAAIGLSVLLKEFAYPKISKLIKQTISHLKKHMLSSVVGLSICLLVMFFQVVPVLGIHPYYEAYYNSLWRITDVAKLFSIGGGVGSDQAGIYLSRKPNAKQLTVRASPVAIEYIGYYFPGKLIPYGEDSPDPDYEVVHLYDIQLKRNDLALNRQLEHVVRINGIDFVWIYGAPNLR